MKVKTFNEWKELGYCVKKGEKATGRNINNIATFTRDQVEALEERRFDIHKRDGVDILSDDDGDYED